MIYLFRSLHALTALICASAATAEIVVSDAYARSSNPLAGAAFVVIENTGPRADRLIGVRSEAAARVELHTHTEDENGVMRMRQIEGGLTIPAGETAHLMRGGDHVMFMGLTTPWAQDDSLTLTLIFEDAGEVEITVPVDQTRNATPALSDH